MRRVRRSSSSGVGRHHHLRDRVQGSFRRSLAVDIDDITPEAACDLLYPGDASVGILEEAGVSLHTLPLQSDGGEAIIALEAVCGISWVEDEPNQKLRRGDCRQVPLQVLMVILAEPMTEHRQPITSP